MKFADRLKFTATGTSTAAITLGAAVGGCRTLAQAMADGAFSVGDTISLMTTDGTAWEDTLFTIGGTAQSPTLSVSRVMASSAGGTTPATFSGPLTVFNAAGAQHFAQGLVDPDDVGYDIWLMIGQSNMVGRGALDALVDVSDSKVMQFGGASAQSRYRTIFPAASPTHNAEALQSTCSPQTHFGNAYGSMIPAHRRVLLVPCAYGGTTLVAPNFNGFTVAPWSAGNPGGTLYENTVTQAGLALAEALKHYPKSRIVGAAMVLGESDADNSITKAAFVAAGEAMIAGLRARLGLPNLLFVIGGMCPEVIAGSTAYQAIRDAHIQIANETSHCVYVAGPSGYYAGDGWHYTAPGSRILGESMALAARTASMYIAPVVPASALTLSLSSPSSGVGVADTVIINTDHPLTGSQTATVSLAAPASVSGAWSPSNSVTLNATNTAAGGVQVQLTPSAAGSGNITATQTAGTPTLTGASIAYTATTEVLTVATPGTQTVGTPYNVAGTYANGTPTALDYSIDGGATWTAAASPTISGGNFSFSVTPTTASASRTMMVRDHNNTSVTATSGSYVVNAGSSGTTFSSTDKASTWAVSGGNLTATNSGSVAWSSIRGTSSKASGKSYFEVVYTGSNRTTIGVGTAAATLSSFVGNDANGWGLINAGGSLYNNGANVLSGSPVSYTAGDVIGVALDADAHAVRFYKNGVVIGSAAATVTSTALFPMVSSEGPDVLTANFGATSFAYTPPAGFSAWG